MAAAELPADVAAAVDKMAEFKVRNGDAFERMIREKHSNDPKFAFLFDTASAAHAYYQQRVAIIRATAHAATAPLSHAVPPPPPPPPAAALPPPSSYYPPHQVCRFAGAPAQPFIARGARAFPDATEIAPSRSSLLAPRSSLLAPRSSSCAAACSSSRRHRRRRRRPDPLPHRRRRRSHPRAPPGCSRRWRCPSDCSRPCLSSARSSGARPAAVPAAPWALRRCGRTSCHAPCRLPSRLRPRSLPPSNGTMRARGPWQPRHPRRSGGETRVARNGAGSGTGGGRGARARPSRATAARGRTTGRSQRRRRRWECGKMAGVGTYARARRTAAPPHRPPSTAAAPPSVRLRALSAFLG